MCWIRSLSKFGHAWQGGEHLLGPRLVGQAASSPLQTLTSNYTRAWAFLSLLSLLHFAASLFLFLQVSFFILSNSEIQLESNNVLQVGQFIFLSECGANLAPHNASQYVSIE